MVTFRSRTVRFGYLLTATLLVLLAGAAVASGIRGWRGSRSPSIWTPEFTARDGLLLAGFAVLCLVLAVLCWLASRQRLDVDETGISWVGPRGRHRLDWAEIGHVDVLIGVRNGQVRVRADRRVYVVFGTVGPLFGTAFGERRLTRVVSRPPETAAREIREVYDALVAGRLRHGSDQDTVHDQQSGGPGRQGGGPGRQGTVPDGRGGKPDQEGVDGRRAGGID
ncbi:hypothetical protein [Plantactinospora sonchi]|uniref:PH domain-containing protein n=1 Tax=Plantactinospora sonchi TaxID=1544735 RepID=A0ABU7RRN5_9ACTN